jgi:phage gp16-like protein
MSELRRLQKTIHVAARDLGLDAEDRRALQLVATGKASMSEMDERDLNGVIDALKARGWTATPKGFRKRAPRPDVRFIHVLWRLLGDAGVVKKDRRALNSFVRTRFAGKWGVILDVDMMTSAAQIRAVTEALKAMCERNGVKLAPRRGGPGT